MIHIAKHRRITDTVKPSKIRYILFIILLGLSSIVNISGTETEPVLSNWVSSPGPSHTLFEPPKGQRCSGRNFEGRRCCIPENPCNEGEGDCDGPGDGGKNDGHAGCKGNLICGSNNCKKFGAYFHEKDDCCEQPSSSSINDVEPASELLSNGWESVSETTDIIYDPPEGQRCKGRNFGGRRCCIPENPCNEGEGDCDGPGDGGKNDGHDGCKGNLICGSNNCKQFGAYFHEKDDCCEMPPLTSSSQLDQSNDWVSSPLVAEEQQSVDETQSYQPPTDQRCSGRNFGGRRCCTPENPCNEGEGDCDGPDDGGQNDGHDGCKGNLICGSNNCKQFGAYFHEKDDCCEMPPLTSSSQLDQSNGWVSSPLIPEEQQSVDETQSYQPPADQRCSGRNFGGRRCCTPENPCNEGEGDCDGPDDGGQNDGHDGCKGNLVCGSNNCKKFGAYFHEKDDCCEMPPPTSSSQLDQSNGWVSSPLIPEEQQSVDETQSYQPPADQRCSGRNFGGRRCCTPEKPCNEGEGDCDGPDDGGQNDGHDGCKGNLICGSNNCKKFGAYFHEKDDCCEMPSLTPSSQFDQSNGWVSPTPIAAEQQSVDEKIKIFEPPNGQRCSGRNFGGRRCCTPENPCNEGEGDCDGPADGGQHDGHNGCKGSLVCGSNNCKKFGEYFHEKDDCCENPNSTIPINTEQSNGGESTTAIAGEQQPYQPPPGQRCSGRNFGGRRCCSPEKPCNEGEGDCDGPDDGGQNDGHAGCKGNLVCGSNNCKKFGAYFHEKDDCCEKQLPIDPSNAFEPPAGQRCSGRNFEGRRCCTPENPCNEGEGDCDGPGDGGQNDGHAGCKGSLECGSNNCKKFGAYFHEKDDCCETQQSVQPPPEVSQPPIDSSFEPPADQRCSGRNFGGRRCCTPESPCNEGEGDCDGPDDGGRNDGHDGCKGSLLCGSNNCKQFGAYFHEKDDCCEKPESDDAGPCVDLETDDYLFEDQEVIQDCNKNVTCSHYASQGFSCAPYYQCQNKDTSPVITSGDGDTDIHVDLRHKNLKNEDCVVLEGTLDASDHKCETEGHVCCKDPDVNAILCDAINNDDVYEKCGRTSEKTKITKLDNKSTGSAQPGEFTHMCVIYRITPEGSQLYHAGASLIAKNKVITVAHKFWVTRTTSSQSVDYRNSPSAFKVRCGEYNVRKEKELIKYQETDVAAMYFHPLYDPTHKFVPNDLVILRTQKNFVYQDHIGPVCLPRPDDKFESDEECFSSGWGKTQFEAMGSYSDILKKIGMGIIPHMKCNKELRKKVSWLKKFKAHKSMVCVGGETGEDTCTGDGGSPHVCKRDGKWVQVGAVAWGIGCGDGIPAIYASIPDAMCWIDQIMTCVPLAATDINNDEDEDIRGTGDLEKISVNELTEGECSAWVKTQNVPDIGDCRVIHKDYDYDVRNEDDYDYVF